ncbi:hypothetical protein ACIRTB_02645 [Streptomyces sp. NPDC101158]|uniref:hypothetical protein n=1 Tax=Streptomyces sp. NPDC101158 TaxID=3366117 RepID=UPI003826BDD7
MSEHTELRGDVTELLKAIAEALDLPVPSIREGDDHKFQRLLIDRATNVWVAVTVLLQHPGSGALKHTTAYVRRHTADHPVTYTPFESSGQDRPGAGVVA